MQGNYTFTKTFVFFVTPLHRHTFQKSCNTDVHETFNAHEYSSLCTA